LRCREASLKCEQLTKALEHVDSQDSEEQQGAKEKDIFINSP
jgi:hypothetical protein